MDRVPELLRPITDAHLDAELNRILSKKKKLQKKLFGKQNKSIEEKYGDLILNRNSAQRTSKGSLISNKMLGSKWLRGKEDAFKDIERDSLSAVQVKNQNLNTIVTNSDIDDDLRYESLSQLPQ